MNNILKISFSFIITFFVGVILPSLINDSDYQSVELQKFSLLTSFKDFGFILINNSIALLVLFSSFIFGRWFLYIFYFINGFLIGLFLTKIQIKIFLLAILPHGVLEITTFFVIGLMIFLVKQGYKIKKRYFWLAYSGLIFSAFIESFITPIILKFFH
ncbi:stage II sporulation protein M [Staphylococcus felis]|uniref:stage II sporulation protein M n=1 Tax=Staphylococcus felis TaxID=46127 RepID=UPI003F41FE78